MSRFNQLLSVVLALLVGIVGTLLLVRTAPESGIAWGQDSVGQGVGVIGMIGPVSVKDVPIVLVDTRSQVIMVYQYNLAREEMDFIQARTYRFDRELLAFPPGRGDKITVQDAQRAMQRQER